MTLHWHRQHQSPRDVDWLSPEELRVLDGFRLERRRADWLLGRYVSKQAVATVLGIRPFDRVQVLAAEDGAPEAFVDGQPAGVEISITHRAGHGVCVVGSGAVGCDLEAIEPRTQRFVNDFFTTRERQVVATATPEEHDLIVALTWSAKESALKVLRSGLRRDTRSVEVELSDTSRRGAGWRPLSVSIGADAMVLPGWWRIDGKQVLTVVGAGEDQPPVAVVNLL